MPRLEPYLKRAGTGGVRSMRTGVAIETAPTDSTLPEANTVSGAEFHSRGGTRIFPTYDGKSGGALKTVAGRAFLTELDPAFVTHKVTPNLDQGVIDLINHLGGLGIKSVLTVGEPHTPYTAAQYTSMFDIIAGIQDHVFEVNGQNEINNIRATAGTRTVTKKALASNTATLTYSGGSIPGSVGEGVTVTSVDATFNGTYTITGKTSTTISYRKVAANVAAVASGGSIKAPVVPPDWKEQARDHLQEIWDRMGPINSARVTAGKTPILIGNANLHSGNLTVHNADLTAVGPMMAPYCDTINFHLYPRGDHPDWNLDDFISRYRAAYGAKPGGGARPIFCTEAGYFEAANYTGGAQVVTEWAHDIYLQKMWLEYASRGAYISQFEFLDDDDPNDSNREASFGLVDVGDPGSNVALWTRKAAFKSLKAMAALKGGNNSAHRVRIEVDGTAEVRHLLVRHSGGVRAFFWRPLRIEKDRVKITPSPVTVPVTVESAAFPTAVINVGVGVHFVDV